jgi:YgiT-type zinc finger domain-containing protein
MDCTDAGCPGTYEDRTVVHTVRHRGHVIVIDHVPAEVFPICGDVLFRPEVVRQIEAILMSADAPAEMVPLYEYAQPA